MNIMKATARVLSVGTLLAVSASPAWAGDCRTNNRGLPAVGGQDNMTVSCKSRNGVTTSGLSAITNVGAGSFTVTANLSAGSQINTQIFNGAGTLVCQAVDTSTGGSPVNVSCTPASPTAWRSIIQYNL